LVFEVVFVLGARGKRGGFTLFKKQTNKHARTSFAAIVRSPSPDSLERKRVQAPGATLSRLRQGCRSWWSAREMAWTRAKVSSDPGSSPNGSGSGSGRRWCDGTTHHESRPRLARAM